MQRQQLLEALHEEKEKSRIDYNRLEELSEQIKQYKNYEKEISISGYLKKLEGDKEQNSAYATLGMNSYLSNFLR